MAFYSGVIRKKHYNIIFIFINLDLFALKNIILTLRGKPDAPATL